MFRKTSFLLLSFTCLLATSVIIEDASSSSSVSASGSALSESGSLMTFPCYIQNCASCPLSPFICENCSNPLSCCSQFCSNCSGNTCNACEDGFSLTANFCVPENPCAKISVPCTQCSGYNCTGCFSGFYVSTQINQCLPCPDQCTACQSQSNCTACRPGFFLNATACSPCSSPCLTCLNSSTTCLSCANGTSLLNSTCVSCGQNCSTCDLTAPTNVTCTACLSGFFLNTSNATNPLCSACPVLCAVCDNANSCTTCAYEGLYYNSTLNQCLPCGAYCSICENSTTCQTCLLNFYISPVVGNNQCVSCHIADCIECVSSTECNICSYGFTPFGGMCYPCWRLIFHCHNCSIITAIQQETCTLCQVNYFLWNNTCLPCPAFCGRCTNQTFCTLCQFGYQTNTTTGECTPGYPMCLYLPGANQCQACSSGYFFHQFACYPCTAANCQFCTSDPLSSSLVSTCTECKQLFYLNNGSCFACSSSLRCSSCTDNSTCSKCSGYNYLNEYGQCQRCPYGCFNCQWSSLTESVECTRCFPSYYLGYEQGQNHQSCIDCDIDYCYYCKPVFNTTGATTVQCLTCIPGFTLINDVCVGCSEGCNVCALETLCFECSPRYGLVDNACDACPQGCSKCDGNSSICTFCQLGYSLNYTSNLCLVCNTIINNCSSCYMEGSNMVICTVCNRGEFLTNNTCNDCSSNCQQCSSNTSCNYCQFSYFLNILRQCIACNQTCENCNSNLSCSSCNTGTYLDPQLGTCLICGSTCTSCQNLYNCYQCVDGYFVVIDEIGFGFCSPCLYPCTQCYDQESCIACSNNYYINEQLLCLPCGSNCEACVNDTVCIKCNDGYQLKDNLECQAISEGLPWWGILLIVIGVLVIIAAIILAVRHFKGTGKTSQSYVELVSGQGS